MLAAGGTLQYDPFRGLRDAYLYDPAQPHVRDTTAAMGGGRWYPTLVTLADGNVLTVSGLGEDGNLDAVPEVYDWQAGHWHALPPSGNWPMYAQLYVLADGRVFYAGAQMGGNNAMLPAVIDFPTAHVEAVHGLSDPDLRNQGASVLLPPAQDQRVLIVGGGPADPHNMAMATGEACVVALAQPHPVYRHAAPLHFPRMHLNAVILPDRTVVVCGGADRQEMTAEASFHAEIYDPVADAWALGAPPGSRACITRSPSSSPTDEWPPPGPTPNGGWPSSDWSTCLSPSDQPEGSSSTCPSTGTWRRPAGTCCSSPTSAACPRSAAGPVSPELRHSRARRRKPRMPPQPKAAVDAIRTARHTPGGIWGTLGTSAARRPSLT